MASLARPTAGSSAPGSPGCASHIAGGPSLCQRKEVPYWQPGSRFPFARIPISEPIGGLHRETRHSIDRTRGHCQHAAGGLRAGRHPDRGPADKGSRAHQGPGRAYDRPRGPHQGAGSPTAAPTKAPEPTKPAPRRRARAAPSTWDCRWTRAPWTPGCMNDTSAANINDLVYNGLIYNDENLQGPAGPGREVGEPHAHHLGLLPQEGRQVPRRHRTDGRGREVHLRDHRGCQLQVASPVALRRRSRAWTSWTTTPSASTCHAPMPRFLPIWTWALCPRRWPRRQTTSWPSRRWAPGRSSS